MIEIIDLSFSYDDTDIMALKNFSLSIPSGQWVAIIGANGSGKSTLAKHLNGLLLPSAGHVLVEELDTEDAEALFAIRQKVAFVFQNPDNQIVGVSVEDDIAFGPENLGMESEQIDQRVEKALAITGLTEVRTKEPYLLSGGEKQRLAIAGALAMSSHYLVLDEPTSMLDPLMRQQVIDTLQYLHDEMGLTIIYVTNIMEEALLAERVVLLGDGCLKADGTPNEIFSDEKLLSDSGLTAPPLCHLAKMLADEGYKTLRGCTFIDDFVEVLCK